MLVLTLFCISCIICITYFSYSATENSLNHSFNREQQASEALFSQSSISIHRGLKLWDSTYNRPLNHDMHILLGAYEESGRDPRRMSLSSVIGRMDPLYRDRINLYLVNQSGVVEFTTDGQEYLMDMRRWPDFYERVKQMMEGDAFVPDEIVKGFNSDSPLRKFVYQPTSDHRYLAEIGLNVQNESVEERAALSYGSLVTYVLNQSPDLLDLNLISSMGTIIGKKAYQSGIPDPVTRNISMQVFETKERVIIPDTRNQTVTTYVFVPNTVEDTPSAQYMNLVAKFTYSSADLNRLITYNFMLHVFLAISASIIAILLAGLVTSRITSPINQLVREIGLIAEGNLDQRISEAHHPELGRIADAVRTMVGQIAGVIRELHASESRYRGLFNTSADAILIIDGDHIIEANPSAETLFCSEGITLTGVMISSLCSPIWEYIHNPECWSRVSSPCPHHPSCSSGTPGVCEADINTGPIEQGGRFLNLRVVPLTHGDHPLLQVQIRDVTRRVEMEQELQRLNVDLERQVKERTVILEATIADLDSFTYTVSHDLRGPLRAIDGNAHLFQIKGKDWLPPEMVRYVSKIHDNIRLMDHLIDDLLNFSRMSREPLEREEVDMNLLVSEVCGEVFAQIPSSSINISCDDLPKARGDSALVRQVLVNLLGNALKFGKKGGCNQIRVTAEKEGDRIWYHVEDTGIGFDMRYADKIFDVFLQLHPEDTYEGTGVGLAIVKRIISRHGGHIRVQSEEGVGSMFSFSLEGGKTGYG